MCVLVFAAVLPVRSVAQDLRAFALPVPAGFVRLDVQPDEITIDDLLRDRIEKEYERLGSSAKPELLKTEANYVRTSASAPDEVLWAGSFQLHPGYYTHAASGPDTSHRFSADQPVMYYTGSVRTPLALPVVSNLSRTLSGDEASYTINLGVLPLPRSGPETDSIRYYVIIERAVESNHTDREVRLERFAKEFSAKANEPIPLRLENAPPEKDPYILRMENGDVLDFYEDFARFLEEHILINSERLEFRLGKQSLSDISSRLSIPYSVAKLARVTLQLMSVVDTGHALTLLDTVRRPADYLTELDMKPYADGPYRYRLIATDLATGKVLFSEQRDFHKTAAIMMPSANRLVPHDTLEVGGKKVDYVKMLNELHYALEVQRSTTERLDATLTRTNRDKRDLEEQLKAGQQNTIAGIHMRAGFGMGTSAGDNLFIGVEASKPSLALDLSFGFLYGSAPYLSYTPPANFSQFTSAPKSIGFQFTWVPEKFFHGAIEPLVAISYYGIWSDPSDPGIHSASLIGAQVGVATEPLGELNGLGLSLAYGATTGLGIGQAAISDLTFKAYVRF